MALAKISSSSIATDPISKRDRYALVVGRRFQGRIGKKEKRDLREQEKLRAICAVRW